MLEDAGLYFKGRWQFEREIVFAGSGKPYAKAAGEAVFEPIASATGEWIYKENGKVVVGEAGKATSFYRSYRYAFREDRLDIFFEDELTQNFNLYQSYSYERQSRSLIATDKHLCNKDVYEGRFSQISEDHYIHTTLIKGPHKDYFITTRFNRI